MLQGKKNQAGRWEGKCVKNGQVMEFHVDPKTGALSNEHLDD